MSTIIMSKCWDLEMPPTQKSVLISLADNANDQGLCWPSIPTISRRTCFSERAVQNAIKWLERYRVLKADRSNGRHTSYTLTPGEYLIGTPAGDAPPQEMHRRRRFTGAGDAPTPAGNAAVPPQEMRQPPQQVPSNRKEPSYEPSLNRKDAAPKRVSSEDLEKEGVTPETARDFLAHRKAKKAPLTPRALAGIKAEADKAGWTLEQALDKAMQRNWVGFESAWVESKQNAAQAAQAPANGGEWWESGSGWEAKAEELNVPRKSGEQFLWFKCRVAKAAGPGKWRELILADLARTKNQHYAQVYEYFNGNPPMEGVG